jgi:hypothetical protein
MMELVGHHSGNYPGVTNNLAGAGIQTAGLLLDVVSPPVQSNRRI